MDEGRRTSNSADKIVIIDILIGEVGGLFCG